MAASKSPLSRLSFQQKTFVFCLLLVSLPLLLYTPPLKSQRALLQEQGTELAWFDVIARDIDTKKMKVGLVNIDKTEHDTLYEQLHKSYPQVLPAVSVKFDRVDENMTLKDFFPEWIDEDHKWGVPKCPDMPMPTLENYQDVNVVVARVPCGNSDNRAEKRGIRDLFRLQVNLVVANLAVEGGWLKLEGDNPREVYVVLVGKCGPMIEIFICDHLLMHQELKVLKQDQRPKLAYLTVLHSSEAYVCGAIALTQSILQTPQSVIQFYDYTRDLILLADDSISPKSMKGLQAAGWKIKRIQRILNPFAQKGSYNEWNYSKLRIWQLTDYDKIIYIDSDFLVLKNMDDFFVYPQLSAAPNDQMFFNSGLMIIEPSKGMFEELMRRVSRLESYNKGDQGFLNEVFTWWHRLPSRLNRLKDSREIEEDELYGMHYLGVKPWMCYKDYDCNWDIDDRRVFASDSAHQLWWDVYEEMPQDLQSYCGLNRRMEERILKWRRRARNANFSDMHWNIKIKDPRMKLGKPHVVLDS